MAPLQVAGDPAIIVGVISAIVAPLYGVVGWMLIRIGIFKAGQSSIDDNEDRIEEVRETIRSIHRQLAELEKDVENIERNQRVIHDNLIDSNPCDSPECKWCRPDREYAGEGIADGGQ